MAGDAGLKVPCPGSMPRPGNPEAGAALDTCWLACAERTDRADESDEAFDLETALCSEAEAASVG
jgi:hypothetical protein